MCLASASLENLASRGFKALIIVSLTVEIFRLISHKLIVSNSTPINEQKAGGNKIIKLIITAIAG